MKRVVILPILLGLLGCGTNLDTEQPAKSILANNPTSFLGEFIKCLESSGPGTLVPDLFCWLYYDVDGDFDIDMTDYAWHTAPPQACFTEPEP